MQVCLSPVRVPVCHVLYRACDSPSAPRLGTQSRCHCGERLTGGSETAAAAARTLLDLRGTAR